MWKVSLRGAMSKEVYNSSCLMIGSKRASNNEFDMTLKNIDI